MKNKDIAILSEVFCSVLERESFMFGMPMDKCEAAADDSMRCAELSFSGEQAKGVISLVLPQALALELAANMLGADPDEDFVIEQASDAIGELLNVLCGQFLTTVEGEIPVFDLGVPAVSSIDSSQWQEMLRFDFSEVLMVEDEYTVLLKLQLES